jgi:hypothetical protein
VLALGMLTAMSKSLKLLEAHYGERLTLASIPSEEPQVYAMIQRADTVGVFQIESRAQMSMLPRLKPANFYDLVIEVAIVRPGPIQGDMVHPYLRRRQGLEPTIYPSKELEAVLGKTLGVPLFQEQAMKIAIVAAGFTPAEADKLRRAMATFRRAGTIQTFQVKMVEGMVARGYEREFAERCFRQIEGFGEYGFPESHAASFALIVYASCWMKCRYPDVFAAAMLNAQPLGFYAPAQLVRDAREHGVEVREVDVNLSDWDCTLEKFPSPLAGEGGGRRPPDEGSARERLEARLATRSRNASLPRASRRDPSSGQASPGHLPPQGGKGRATFVIYDPVMVASSGDALAGAGFVAAVRARLLPLVDCLTPNLAEAAALLGQAAAASEEEMTAQGRALLALGPRAVLMKGGHLAGAEAVDLLVTADGVRRFAAPRLASPNLHGTGCTLSSAIAAHIVLGAELGEAVAAAKAFVTAAIERGRGVTLGEGAGPLLPIPLR